MESKNKIALKEKITKIISESTAHGLPSILRADHFITKTLWTISTVCSLFACVWFELSCINTYLDYDTVTKIESVYEQPTQFPTVAICSLSSLGFNDRPLKSLVNYCMFRDSFDCLNEPDRFFDTFRDPQNGICYRFNSGRNMTNHSVDIFDTILSGRDHGLSITFNESVGLAINIYNHSIPPYPNEKHNSYSGDDLTAMSGFVTDFRVSKIFDYKLPRPYNDCIEEATQFNSNKTILEFMARSGEAYNQQGCLKLCFNLHYMNENPCNCTSSAMDSVWFDCFTSLEKDNLTGCTNKYKINFVSNHLLRKCSEYCPLECDTMYYSIGYSLGSYKWPKVKFRVYFVDSSHTVINQKAKILPIDLVSNMGGILGLFIGISFLSLIEIFEIFIEFFLIYFIDKTNQHNNKITVVNRF